MVSLLSKNYGDRLTLDFNHGDSDKGSSITTLSACDLMIRVSVTMATIEELGGQFASCHCLLPICHLKLGSKPEIGRKYLRPNSHSLYF